MAGKSAARTVHRPSRDAASMRPRLGGRGRDAPPQQVHGRTYNASMRPRLGGRGRGPWKSTVSSGLRPCFNEAPARWPGKRRSFKRSLASTSSSFNEAPARWPGKRWMCRTGRDDTQTGFNEAPARWPGKSPTRWVSRSIASCTCFNEAPARWPGKRRLERVGDDLSEVASMRPRLGGRGRVRVQLVMRQRIVASMRPRLGGRGRVFDGSQYGDIEIMLQ